MVSDLKGSVILPNRQPDGELSDGIPMGAIVGRYLAVVWIALMAVSSVVAAPPFDKLPYRNAPISYFSPANDPVAQLALRLDNREVEWAFDEKAGYLREILRELEIPESSQLLVFAKNAANARLISPKNPRAIYFREDVSVGWTPGAAQIELMAVDPQRGPVFYTLSARDRGRPKIVRNDTCLTCHVSESTCQVPGLPLRSFITDEQGKPLSGYSQIDAATEYSKRWGGFYVTGTPTGFVHLGNMRSDDGRTLPPSERDNNRLQLAGAEPVQRHLIESSHVIAHLVHDHQDRVITLLSRLRCEYEFERELTALPTAIDALLFVDEPVLPVELERGSPFCKWFEASGRSPLSNRLRQLDLTCNLTTYQISWLFDTRQFRELPANLREKVLVGCRKKLEDIARSRADDAADPRRRSTRIGPRERLQVWEELECALREICFAIDR